MTCWSSIEKFQLLAESTNSFLLNFPSNSIPRSMLESKDIPRWKCKVHTYCVSSCTVLNQQVTLQYSSMETAVHPLMYSDNYSSSSWGPHYGRISSVTQLSMPLSVRHDLHAWNYFITYRFYICWYHPSLINTSPHSRICSHYPCSQALEKNWRGVPVIHCSQMHEQFCYILRIIHWYM